MGTVRQNVRKYGGQHVGRSLLDRPHAAGTDHGSESQQFARGSDRGRGASGRHMQIEMTIKGLMVDPITNMPIVILRDKDGQRVLPIWVGVFEANAIALQIENVTTPRPMTHDLLRNVIHDLKADILKIVVSDLKENTFYALIHLQVNGEPLAVDARPSDAIALALRAQAPIYVEDRVIDNAKTVDFAPDKGDTERLQKWLESLDPDDMGKYKM